MSCTVQFAPEAQTQLDAIEEYIAIASGFPATAAHFVDGIIAYCESFETFPERGTRLDDLLSVCVSSAIEKASRLPSGSVSTPRWYPLWVSFTAGKITKPV